MITSLEGDVVEGRHGVFRDDTRFLSFYEARINGQIPTALTSNNTTHYSSAHYLTNPDLRPRQGSDDIEKQNLAIERKRFIEQDIREEYFITNVSESEQKISLVFKLDADFADLFLVKSRVFDGPGAGSKYIIRNPRRIAKKFLRKNDNAFQFTCFDEKTKFHAETLVWFSKKGNLNKDSISYDISLKPQKRFHLTIVILLLSGNEKRKREYSDLDFIREEKKIERALKKWQLSVPTLETNWDELKHSYSASLVDLVSLTMVDPTSKQKWELPAAGCPWFMTLFGRDTIITSYQSMLFGRKLATGAVKALSEYQAINFDKEKEAEPGKILHELRFGDYAISSKRYPYYGSIDSTPLFLILISEIFRWSRDHAFANRYRKNISNALLWIEKFGDFNDDGFVEYKKRSEAGLENQCWKDSSNSILFSNGRLAKPPIAACEVQGYVYDAKLRIAELATQVWKDGSLAKKLEDEAAELKKLFNEKFWIEERGYYALAIDGEKKKVDSMTSNNGHLLWSGIIDERKAKSVVRKLLSEDMFSGYGIRTMSTKDAGYNPIGYHNGCVWTHDNSLIAAGLARYDYDSEAIQVIDALLSAAPHFGYTMPEAFSGFRRMRTGFPVRYPSACSPQAWAAGSCLLLLRTLLGITPSHSKKEIGIKPMLRDMETMIELKGIKAFGKSYEVIVRDGSKPEIHETQDAAKN